MIYCWRGIIELRTPLHVGGGEDNGFEQPVLRDAFGAYRIPGSSIAGVLREFVQERCPELVEKAFGVTTRPRQLGTQQKTEATGISSAIWCADALLLDFDDTPAMHKLAEGKSVDVGLGPYIRDHVRLDKDTGAAEKGGKFDEEIVPAGSRFALCITLDGWNTQPEPILCNLFEGLCHALEEGHITFGGKQASGFGQVRVVESACRRFDLKSEAGMQAWLNLAPAPLFEAGEGEKHAARAALPDRKTKGISGSITLPLVSHGPLLVGGGVPEADADVDIAFYREAFADYTAKENILRKVVPGSSLRGVLRHRVRHIAQTLGVDADSMINSLFGSTEGKEGTRSKVRVEDAPLQEAKTPVVVQHVAIDRFTGGAMESALYTEGPLWQEQLAVPLSLHVQGLEDAEAAVLLHALLDMCEGTLPVGAGGNRGNGTLCLRGIDKGIAQTLQGVTFSFSRAEETLNTQNTNSWNHWLDRLEQALPKGAV